MPVRTSCTFVACSMASSSLDLICSLRGHEEDQVWCVSWSHDGKYLASCGLDKVIRIYTYNNPTNTSTSWNVGFIDHFMSGKQSSDDISKSGWLADDVTVSCIATLEEAQSRTLRSCDWSPDGTYLASASFDGTVIVWEAQNSCKTVWEQIASLEGHDSEVKCVSWNCDGSLLATCGRDKKIWIWEKLHAGEYECVSVLEGHTQDVKFVKFHYNLQILFSCSYDDTVKLWYEDGDDWFCKSTLSGHKSTVWGLSVSSHEAKIVTCSDDLNVKVWECDRTDFMGNWRIIESINDSHRFPIYSIDWNRDHGRIVTGSGANDIAIFTKDLVEEGRVSDAHDNDVNCVRWNPNTKYDSILASCGDDGVVKIWRHHTNL